MLKIALRGLIAHKLRLVLSAIAVVLGVAFIVGTFVLTDSSRATFDTLFTKVFANVDLAVRNQPPFGDRIGQDRAPVPESLVAEVQGVPGVATAEGQLFGGPLVILDQDGDAVRTGGPVFGTNAPAADSLSPYLVSDGRWPEGPDEIAMDKATIDKNDFEIGTPVRITVLNERIGTRAYTLVGAITLGDAPNFGGAAIVGFETQAAQVALGREGEFDQIFISVADGAVPEQVARDIERTIGNRYDVVTGADVTSENLDQINEFLSIFEQLLLGFALIGLFVGTFIIFNTFSMVVAQRTREMALIRALGASRGQVIGSVMGEAALVGAVASALGIVAGYGLAALLQYILERQDFAPPNGTLVLQASRVVIALAVGIGVTLFSALVPAVRASRVPPLAAVRRADQSVGARHPGWTWAGIAGLAVGGLVLWLGLGQTGGDKFQTIGFGALLVVLGAITVAAPLARPSTRFIGKPFRRGVAGELAYENAQRNPRRSAVTASALMIGLTLVSATMILAASISKSIRAQVESTFEADLTLTQDFGEFSGAVRARVAEVDGVERTAAVRFGNIKVEGKVEDVVAMDAAGVDALIRLDATEGAGAAMAQGQILVHDEFAADKGWAIGDELNVRYPARPKQKETVTIGGLYSRQGFFGDYIIPLSIHQAKYTEQVDDFVLVGIAAGRMDEVRPEIEKILKADFPNVKAQDRDEFTRDQERQVTQILFIFFALLFLSLLIAGIGVMNTMALSVFERTREIGLLRAVGMSRRQIRTMIRRESVIICIFGALLGIVLGIGFGVVLVEALGEFNINELDIPPGQLIFVVLSAAFLGVVAALFPARRAARLDVLDAVTHD